MIKYLPFGRINEYLATLTEEQKQRTACMHRRNLGDNTAIKIFKTRQAMVRIIRAEEKNSPYSRWSPVVKLKDGEGY